MVVFGLKIFRHPVVGGSWPGRSLGSSMCLVSDTVSLVLAASCACLKVTWLCLVYDQYGLALDLALVWLGWNVDHCGLMYRSICT